MKTIHLTFILFFFVSLTTVNNINAQTEMGWDSHGVGFAVPNDYYVEANTYSEFSFTNGSVYISLMPWQDGSVGESDLAEGVIEAANQMNYSQLAGVEYFEHDYFAGYSVGGIKDGLGSVISLVLDTESSTNLLIVATFQPGYEDQATRILDTIYAYD